MQKGQKITEETRLKMRKAQKLNKSFISIETRKKMSLSRKGFKPKKETLVKMSESLKGKTPWNKGVKCPYFKNSPKGDKHWKWNGGNKNRDIHSLFNPEYVTWRNNVFKRDDFKCKMCGGKDKLQAHHILRWHDYPELRYETNNGIVLCKKHHPRRKEDELKLSPYFRNLIKENSK